MLTAMFKMGKHAHKGADIYLNLQYSCLHSTMFKTNFAIVHAAVCLDSYYLKRYLRLHNSIYSTASSRGCEEQSDSPW